MSALVRCEGCEKEISKKAASCPSCGHPNKAKHLSGGSVLATFAILALFLWWMAPSGGGQVMMNSVHNQVVDDALKQYDIVKRSSEPMQACVHAGVVAAAYLQAKDEPNYQIWLKTKNRDCRAAELP